MIKVTKDYTSDKTNGRHIAPGLYADNDTSLFGLADFLVKSGRAVTVPDKPAPVEATEPATPRKTKD